MTKRVLVVDDEPDVCRLVTFNLRNAGFIPTAVSCGAEALLEVGMNQPDVIVLDVGLPDISGLDVCRKLRTRKELRDIGILMLTAAGLDEDKIDGLQAGADDYVIKPFNVQELILRVGALARRIGERKEARLQPSGTVIYHGALSVDTSSHEVRDGQNVIDLRPLEYKLLVTMLSEAGRVFSRQELLCTVWEMEQGGSPRTVDVHIRRLRQNLGDYAGVVETVPGFGYRVQAGG